MDRARLAVLAVVALVWFTAPVMLSRAYVDLLVFAGLYTIAGLGVAVLLGYCGIVSLAQPVFYAVGAYSTAYFTVTLGLPALIAASIGIAVSAGIAYVLGRPILNLGSYYLALATLALSIIGSVLYLEATPITGGTLGVGGIPRIGAFGFLLATPVRYYFFVWTVAFLCMWLCANLVRSRTGLAIRAMRDAPDAAMMLAIETRDLRVRMFVLSAVLGALAGSLFAHYVTFVSVYSFDVEKSIVFLLLAVLGGVYNVWGAALGALFITLVPQMFSGLGAGYRVVFGIVLVLVVVAFPRGLAGALSDLVRSAKAAADGRRHGVEGRIA